MGGRGGSGASAPALKEGGKFKAHHMVYGDVTGTVTKIHKSGSIVGTVETSSRGFGRQTGVAFRKGDATPSR